MPPKSAPDLGALVAQNHASLQRFLEAHAARWLLHRESVSDLTQTVYRELVASAASVQYRSEQEFRGWLYATARNKLVDRVRFYRRDRRDVRREIHAADPSIEGATAQTPSRISASREEIARCGACLDLLPPIEREVILLCRFGQLSAAEAGSVLGRGEGATRALLSRSLARLSTLMERTTRDRSAPARTPE
jgi:RNA polymerase sigma-70 factor (ECF subfamily)